MRVLENAEKETNELSALVEKAGISNSVSSKFTAPSVPTISLSD